MAIYQDGLTIDVIKRGRYGPFAYERLELKGTLTVREINEVARFEAQEFDIILGLNSVSLIETTYRLEFQDRFAVHDEVRPDVPDVLTRKEDRNDTFGLIRDLMGPERDFESAVVHAFGVSGPEGRPDSLGNLANLGIHII